MYCHASRIRENGPLGFWPVQYESDYMKPQKKNRTFKQKKDCTIGEAKTKALISYAFGVLDLTYVKGRYLSDMANIESLGKELIGSIDFLSCLNSCGIYKRFMSRIMRKPNFCLCENKAADQLCSNCTAGQRLCFRYTDSAVPLLLKSEISASSHLL